jgi:3-dehydroquinate dehydratase II
VLKVEIHLSNIHTREPRRRHSMISPAVDAVVAGMGPYGYEAAVGYILKQSNA